MRGLFKIKDRFNILNFLSLMREILKGASRFLLILTQKKISVKLQIKPKEIMDFIINLPF